MLPENAQPRRLLVVLPNWVGDVILASPVLDSLRSHFANTHITYLMRAHLRPVLAGAGWQNDDLAWPAGRGAARWSGLVRLLRALRARRFDAALLLTNSLRSALVTWLAGIPRRTGYARDGRSLLLTQRLRPLRADGEFLPAPVTDAYARLAEAIGCSVQDRRLRLTVTQSDEREAEQLLRRSGIELRQPYAVINPGAAFGAAKCWLPERFGALCARIDAELSLRPLIVGAPGEAPLLEEIARSAQGRGIACTNPGTTLGSLRALIRGAALLVCNDSGPRHMGIAFGVPMVTIFGPTHQEWTATDAPREIRLQAHVPCGPCQLRTCPLDHRCMTSITTDIVMDAVRAVLRRHADCAAPRAPVDEPNAEHRSSA